MLLRKRQRKSRTGSRKTRSKLGLCINCSNGFVQTKEIVHIDIECTYKARCQDVNIFNFWTVINLAVGLCPSNHFCYVRLSISAGDHGTLGECVHKMSAEVHISREYFFFLLCHGLHHTVSL